MTFRTRLVLAITLMTMVSLGSAFAATWFVVTSGQKRSFDVALRAEATEEANEAASLGGQHLAVLYGTGTFASDVGPLTRYVALFSSDGQVLAATSTLIACGGIPPYESIRHPQRTIFNFQCGPVTLRGLLAPLPGPSGNVLLLSAARTEIDAFAVFLARAMAIGFAIAVAWVSLVATWVVRVFTRDHKAIAAVARRVAAGDLEARVGSRSKDREIAQLAFDVDEMIARLAVLVESQQRFVANAAHELRSPLTTLYGELSHALRRSRDGDEYRRVIEEALESTRRLKHVTEDVLVLARLGADNSEPVPFASVAIEEVTRAAADSLAAEARELQVAISIECDDARVRGWPRDLERMARNLIENAIRHSPAGGRVDVRARRREGGIEVIVSDQGPGVPPADGERIFEPFFRGSWDRAKETYGSGLGLSIVRELARAHGGDARLDQDDHGAGGARFVVTLPSESRPPGPQ